MLKEGLRVLASRRSEETENIRVDENDESVLTVIESLKATRNTEDG
jgi:hypothetical protein